MSLNYLSNAYMFYFNMDVLYRWHNCNTSDFYCHGHAYSFGYSINHTLHVLSMHKNKGFPCLVILTGFWNPLNFFIYQKVDNDLGNYY
jgi:hypothetical protein